jgi:LEA14-like dessication related protein
LVLGSRKIVLIGAIAAVAAAIILVPYIQSLSAPDINRVTVRVVSVKLDSAHSTSQNLQLQVTFTIDNPTNQSVTTSSINYAVAANDIPVGNGNLSYEDVPVNGRPAIFAASSQNLTSSFSLQYSDSIASIFNKIQADPSSIRWHVTGDAVIATALTEIDRPFDSTI